MTEIDNQRHWTDDTRGVYEVWYMTWNHPRTDQGFWLRYIIEAPDHGPRARASCGSRASIRSDPTRRSRSTSTSRAASCGARRRRSRSRSATASSATTTRIGELAGDGHEIAGICGGMPARRSFARCPPSCTRAVGSARPPSSSPIRASRCRARSSSTARSYVRSRDVRPDAPVGRKHAYSWIWGHCAEFAGAPDVCSRSSACGSSAAASCCRRCSCSRSISTASSTG